MIAPRFYTVSQPMALEELLSGLDVNTLDGKFLDEMIETPAALSDSMPGQITFFQNKRLASELETAKATACFVPKKLAGKVSEKQIIAILSDHPRGHFARACERLVREGGSDLPDSHIDPSANIHPTAIIGDGVEVGKGAKIDAYAVIGDGVIIGAGTHIAAHASIEFSILGQNCKIKSGAVIGGAGFGVTKDESGIIDIPHLGRVIMGDRVSIGAKSCIDRGQLGDTILGDDVKLDNLVQVAHNVQVGSGTMMAAHVGISGSCVIGAGCQFGGRVGLADHMTVGDGAILAANAGVMHNIPAGEMWSGIPAMPIREHMRLISATRKLIKKQGDPS